MGSQTTGAEDGLAFSMSAKGGIRDAQGDVTWPFSLQQWGEVHGSDGHVEFRLTLISAAGTYLYAGTGALAEVTQADGEGTAYRFEGTFDLVDQDQPAAGIPWRGFVSTTLRVWSDGTLYAGSLALQDASA